MNEFLFDRRSMGQQFDMSATVSSTSVLEQFVQRASQLYSLPAVAVEVLQLTNRPDANVQALKECIENDPALTAKVLRTVNSSLFGLNYKVGDLNQALSLLGTKPLKLLVLGFSLPKELFNNLESQVLSRYWQQSIAKAVAARQFCEKIWNLPGDEAFIAGLLQDLGQLVLLQELGEPYVQFLDHVYISDGDVLEQESISLGFDHAVLSARILDHWGLPESIVHAIALPFDCQRLKDLPEHQRPVAQSLHLGALTSRVFDSRPRAFEQLVNAFELYGGGGLERLQTLVNSFEDKIKQISSVFSLRLSDQPDYQQVLLDAFARLSEASEPAAAELAADKVKLELPAPSADVLPAESPTPARDPLKFKVKSPPRKSHPDAGFVGAINSGLQTARQQRTPLSLLLFELDEFDDLILHHGLDGTRELLDRLASTLGELQTHTPCLQLSDARLGLLLEDFDRQQAIAFAQHASRKMKLRNGTDGRDDSPCTVSTGIATVSRPPKTFPPEELIEAAERCLFAAQIGNGNGLKSIDIL